jgi:ribose transport system substrate-binding protein
MSHQIWNPPVRLHRANLDDPTQEVVVVLNARKTSVCVLAVALAGVAGCSGGGADEGSTTKGGGGAAAKPVKASEFCGPECQKQLALQAKPEDVKCKVGLALNSLGSDYATSQKRATEKAVKDFFPNMELVVTNGQDSATTQTSNVDDMVARGIDVLMITPFDSKALAPAVEEAAGQGVKVIAFDRDVETDKRLTYIASDNVEAGEVSVGHLVKKLNGKGNIIELQGALGVGVTTERHQGLQNAIKENPGIKVVESQTANYEQEQGLKVTEDLLQRFPKGEIQGIYAHDDLMALGAVQAVKEANREDEITVVGIDASGVAIEAIEKGDYYGTVVYPTAAPENVIAAAKACVDEKLDERIVLESFPVTKENAAKYRPQH